MFLDGGCGLSGGKLIVPFSYRDNWHAAWNGSFGGRLVQVWLLPSPSQITFLPYE